MPWSEINRTLRMAFLSIPTPLRPNTLFELLVTEKRFTTGLRRLLLVSSHNGLRCLYRHRVNQKTVAPSLVSFVPEVSLNTVLGKAL